MNELAHYLLWQGFYIINAEKPINYMTPLIDAAQEMQTLSECLEQSVDDGYAENFNVVRGGLASEDGKSIYRPADVTIPNFYRFEGYSDPEDNSILYLIETKDGRRGTVIDAYGAYADGRLSNFIRQVDDIQKKLNLKRESLGPIF